VLFAEERGKLSNGELYALNMNKDLIEKITMYETAQDQDEKNDLVQMTGMKFLREEEVAKSFFHFLIDAGAITPEFDYTKTAEVVNMKDISSSNYEDEAVSSKRCRKELSLWRSNLYRKTSKMETDL